VPPRRRAGNPTKPDAPRGVAPARHARRRRHPATRRWSKSEPPRRLPPHRAEARRQGTRTCGRRVRKRNGRRRVRVGAGGRVRPHPPRRCASRWLRRAACGVRRRQGANALANKLKKNGYAAYVQPVETSRGTLWRVRVGGYATRPEADAARVDAEGRRLQTASSHRRIRLPGRQDTGARDSPMSFADEFHVRYRCP
jgi:hypothetical protein